MTQKKRDAGAPKEEYVLPEMPDRLVFGQHKPCKKCKGKGIIHERGKEAACLRCGGLGVLTEE